MFIRLFKLLGDDVWQHGLVLVEGREYNVGIFFLLVLAVALEAYLIGAFNTADMISKTFYKTDIRTKGSGNAGTTNMMRTFGVGPAAATLLGDMLKTLIAMSGGTLLLGINGAYIAGLFAVLGHIAPVYYRFKGGKGFATTVMIILYIDVKVFILLMLVFVLLVWTTKYLSLGSVMVALFFPLIAERNDPWVQDHALRLILSLAIAALVVYMHRSNIKRIMNGTENKFSFRKTQKRTDTAVTPPARPVESEGLCDTPANESYGDEDPDESASDAAEASNGEKADKNSKQGEKNRSEHRPAGKKNQKNKKIGKN